MKTFEIEIKETLSRIVKVKAKTENEAFAIVKQMYNNEDVILDSDDFVDVEIIKKLN